jgi:hypothetical protein
MTTTTTPQTPGMKTWVKRLEDYRKGGQISKSLINRAKGLIASKWITVKDGNLDLWKMLKGTLDYELNTGATTRKGAVRFNITPDQTAQGLEWLKRDRMKRLLGDQDFSILVNFSHFLFVGIEVVDATRHDAYPQFRCRPVYRVISKSGSWFDYASSPWQSGQASFDVLARGSK